MGKRIFVICLAAILLGSNCKKSNMFGDDKLSLKKEFYQDSQLKMNGYYYRNIDNHLTVYFLFKNGIILYGSTFPINELNKHEEEYKTLDWQSAIKRSKYRWGVFNIETNSIKFERWYPSEPPLKAYVREGQILNDTTFVVSQFYRLKGGRKTELETLNETYHFKPFSPKPDSTNNFIK